jgi:hypothetical protein
LYWQYRGKQKKSSNVIIINAFIRSQIPVVLQQLVRPPVAGYITIFVDILFSITSSATYLFSEA